MKKFTAILVALLLILTCVAAAACNVIVMVYLENYDGVTTKVVIYNPNQALPTPERQGYEFDGWYMDRELTVPFVNGVEMDHSFRLYAKWIAIGYGDGDGTTHTKHVFESYFTYGKCTDQGCNVYGRNEASSKYFSLADYTLESEMSTIEDHYNALVFNIRLGNNQTQFDTLYDQYYTDVDTVVEQYELIYLLSDVDTSLTDKCYDAGDYYDLTVARFYGLYELIYNSNYRSYFYADWSSDDIQDALDLAERYNNSSDDSSELNTIMKEYNSLLEEIDYYYLTHNELSSGYYTSINNLYKRMVTANNSIASGAGYDGNKNYMDYAYENVYSREYAPLDVAEMRNYVKTVIAPIFAEIAEEYYDFYYYSFYHFGRSYFSDATNSNYYKGLVELPIVNTASATAANANAIRSTVNYVGDYFNYLSETSGIDFIGEANKLYQNGNYFTGAGDGAYTTTIQNKPVVYFQEDGYDTAFTFVHEFGHYYDFVVNGALTRSMDHCETQSQGDEMMFLAWLMNNKPVGITNGFTAVEISQLFDILSAVILSTAVDELEQAAYSGTYNGAPITDYNATFKNILATYGGADEFLNSDYWFYVVFDNAAYYISYAMSALPAIEIYAKAGSGGLDNARTSYLKLFTYSSNNSFLGTDGNDGKQVTASYEQILNWCGLHSAFQPELYLTIQNYFNSRG